ncbi:sulfur carrier protein ThiS [Limisalsivibrio acetivorans]|uniref:sulfur carrier protein ThiS n=1 Tax=Limisalsivibrio acetivorans TaxID=1304888 RepID=UPI0003B6986B|nr:sulfur carrier protein ThiS [Limisalsivibrio acetivorans]
MKVKVNGKETDIEEGMNIKELIESYSLSPERVVIELNGDIPPRDSFEETFVKEGDSVEIINFVGGG